jgi:hypothetical protein
MRSKCFSARQVGSQPHRQQIVGDRTDLLGSTARSHHGWLSCGILSVLARTGDIACGQRLDPERRFTVREAWRSWRIQSAQLQCRHSEFVYSQAPCPVLIYHEKSAVEPSTPRNFAVALWSSSTCSARLAYFFQCVLIAFTLSERYGGWVTGPAGRHGVPSVVSGQWENCEPFIQGPSADTPIRSPARRFCHTWLHREQFGKSISKFRLQE